jgi:ribosomal protein L13
MGKHKPTYTAHVDTVECVIASRATPCSTPRYLT